MSYTAKTFQCSGCGAPIPIPSNSKGRVKCPSCKIDCVLEGLVKNAEMAEKENINSGIPLSASPATLHKQLVNVLSESPCLPLDIFEKGEVVREEHHCAPAYLFYCNGTGSYTYDIAQWTTHKTAIDLGDSTRVEKEQIKDYRAMSGQANVSDQVFTSGNRAVVPQINGLYMFLDANKLVDYDELAFPHDVITYEYNLPQAAAFNEYVKPYMEKLLEKQARKILDGQDYRNFVMGGGNRIDKDEIVRVFLGFYHIVFKYGDKEYSIWVTGNGEKVINGGVPVDTHQQEAVRTKKQAMEREVSSIPVPNTSSFMLKLGVSIIGGIILGLVFHWAFLIFGFAGAAYFWMQKNKLMNPYNAQCAAIRAKYQNEINALESRWKNVVQQFKERKKGIRGIYEAEVTGDANAF